MRQGGTERPNLRSTRQSTTNPLTETIVGEAGALSRVGRACTARYFREFQLLDTRSSQKTRLTRPCPAKPSCVLRCADERSGSVCLDVINQSWSPMYDLKNIFDVFLPQLLTYGNAADPLNPEAAALMLREPEKFRVRVKGKSPAGTWWRRQCAGARKGAGMRALLCLALDRRFMVQARLPPVMLTRS